MVFNKKKKINNLKMCSLSTPDAGKHQRHQPIKTHAQCATELPLLILRTAVTRQANYCAAGVRRSERIVGIVIIDQHAVLMSPVKPWFYGTLRQNNSPRGALA